MQSRITTMVRIEELVSTLEGLKRPGRFSRIVQRARALLLRGSQRHEHLAELERELTASALRLAAKANLLSDILDSARRLQCTHYIAEAHELARTLMYGPARIITSISERTLACSSHQTRCCS
eukprot:m51a1_g14080 hypothetical protein (123) ;mRNA; f:1305749-1306117